MPVERFDTKDVQARQNVFNSVAIELLEVHQGIHAQTLRCEPLYGF